jgi:hypothetical protein
VALRDPSDIRDSISYQLHCPSDVSTAIFHYLPRQRRRAGENGRAIRQADSTKNRKRKHAPLIVDGPASKNKQIVLNVDFSLCAQRPAQFDIRPESHAVCCYFFIKSSTALVMAMSPVRMVGSGTGANLLECKLGNGVPVFLLSAAFAGSTAPTLNMNAGIE